MGNDSSYLIEALRNGDAYSVGNVMPTNQGLAPYGLRHTGDGAKGKGFYGFLPNKTGEISTEISAEDEDIGEYPLIVPNLSTDELNHVLSNERPTDEIYDKARQHAIMRKSMGRSPFIESNELTRPTPEGFTGSTPMLKNIQYK